MSKKTVRLKAPSRVKFETHPRGLSGVQLANRAIEQNCKIKELCIICGDKIKVQIFKGSGVCCELHRKVRDNDFGIARAISP